MTAAEALTLARAAEFEQSAAEIIAGQLMLPSQVATRLVSLIVNAALCRAAAPKESTP